MYKATQGSSIRRLIDGVMIPPDEGNRDYQEYLDWAAQGNTIAPVDPPTPEEVAETARVSELDAQIHGSATLASLKLMSNTEFNTWWSANVTSLAQASTVLKLLARVILRRVL